MTDPRPEYLASLLADMADPAKAPPGECGVCGWAVRLRDWPATGDDALTAFLDGLQQLAEATGAVVFGLWTLGGGELPAEDPDPNQLCELWRATDRTLVGIMPIGEAIGRLTSHNCGGWN